MSKQETHSWCRVFHRTLAIFFAVVLSTMLQTPSYSQDPIGDYGDAPDSVGSGFPTKYATTNSRLGGHGAHHLTTGLEMLGLAVSDEAGAEDPLDPDGAPNLVDRDAFDDGVLGILTVQYGIAFGGVQLSDLYVHIRITIDANAPAQSRYLNILYDTNRDMEWRNTGYANEWLLQNFDVDVAPGTTEDLWVSLGRIPAEAIPSNPPYPWLRATLTRSPIDAQATAGQGGWDGSGDFEFGETEDYNTAYISGGGGGGPDCRCEVEIDPEPLILDHTDWDIITCTLTITGRDSGGANYRVDDKGTHGPGPLMSPDSYYTVEPGVVKPGAGGGINPFFWQYLITPVTHNIGLMQSFDITFRYTGFCQGQQICQGIKNAGVLIFHPYDPNNPWMVLARLVFDPNKWPVGEWTGVTPEGGSQPLAYVKFGNNQPTPGTANVFQLYAYPPGIPGDQLSGVIPATWLVSFHVDSSAQPEGPLVATQVTGLRLAGYTDQMLEQAGVHDKSLLQPFMMPLRSAGYFDTYSEITTNVGSSVTLDLYNNTISIEGPNNFPSIWGIIAAKTNPGQATYPVPMSPETNKPLNPALAWRPGEWVQDVNGHALYLGTNYNEVNSASTSSPVYMGRYDVNSYTVAGPLAEGTTYYWRIDEYNDVNGSSPWGGRVWQFITKTGAASNPQPVNGADSLKMPLELTWTPGDWSPNEHRVYFGTSFASVSVANTTSGARYRGTVSSPVYPLSRLLEDRGTPAGPDWVLAPNTTYYWRIDERDSGGTFRNGTVWSFNTSNFCLIEDFQSYSNTDELNDVWLTGVPVPPSGLAGTGRIALVREGASGRYMQFSYDKSCGTEKDPRLYFSEVDYPYSGSGADWTGGGVLAVRPTLFELKYRGFASNSADPVYDRMYVAIEDTQGDVSVTMNPDPNAQLSYLWTKWDIAFSDLNSQNPNMDISRVSDLYIGFGLRGNDIQAGGDGNVMFDDIKLFHSTCVPAFGPVADLTGDCKVDINDIYILSNDWLLMEQTYNWTATQQAPAEPVLWYRFDETSGSTCADSGTGDSNNYSGSVVGFNPLTWDTDGGRDGNGCLYLPAGAQSYVSAPPEALYFVESTSGVSFSLWINADISTDEFHSYWPSLLGVWDGSSELLEVHCPTQLPPENPFGPACNFIKGIPYESGGAVASTGIRAIDNFGGRWNHWAFVKEPEQMLVYCNGQLVADINSTDDVDVNGPLFALPVDAFRIGTGGDNRNMWAGRIDDFMVFNYPLSENEVRYIATDGTGILSVPLISPANIKSSSPQIVNFGDFALMAGEWLTEKLWP